MTIISFKHRFIFIRPSKVAGTSLELALSHFCGKDDVMSPFRSDESNQLRERYYPYPVRDIVAVVNKNGQKREAQLSRHMSADNLLNVLGDDVFRSFLKISVIRNPYDRVVSRYAWRRRRRDLSQKRSVSRFRKWFLQREAGVFRRHSTLKRPYDAVDFMIRFEHFEADLTALSQKLGLAENIYDTFKDIREKGDVRPKSFTARACFEGFPEGIEKVKNLYAIELEMFGYDLPWLSEGLSGGLSAEEGQRV